MVKRLEFIDIYFSAYLTLHGLEPRLINKAGKIIFVFDATDQVYQYMAEYHSNTAIPCLDLITAIKALRGKMLTEKENGKGEKYGNRKR